MKTKNIDTTKQSEGLRLNAYKCPADVWTIGYGHTRGVKEGDTCTDAEAEQMLRDDLRDAENAVNMAVKVRLNQNQFDALADFTFNLGGGNLRSSTLLKKLNAGDYIGAANEFKRWDKAGGKVLNGLVARRLANTNRFIGAE